MVSADHAPRPLLKSTESTIVSISGQRQRAKLSQGLQPLGRHGH
jgi:hypothetical protein